MRPWDEVPNWRWEICKIETTSHFDIRTKVNILKCENNSYFIAKYGKSQIYFSLSLKCTVKTKVKCESQELFYSKMLPRTSVANRLRFTFKLHCQKEGEIWICKVDLTVNQHWFEKFFPLGKILRKKNVLSENNCNLKRKRGGLIF